MNSDPIPASLRDRVITVSENRGDQGRTDSNIREECRFGRDREKMEFRWRRGSARERQNWNKGNTKGENDKMSMGQDKSEALEKGQR